MAWGPKVRGFSGERYEDENVAVLSIGPGGYEVCVDAVCTKTVGHPGLIVLLPISSEQCGSDGSYWSWSGHAGMSD